MTNLIPIRPIVQEIKPLQTIERLHALCDKLKQVKNDAVVLEQSLRSDDRVTPHQRVAHSAACEAVILATNGINLVCNAIAELIIETVADVIVSEPVIET